MTKRCNRYEFPATEASLFQKKKTLDELLVVARKKVGRINKVSIIDQKIKDVTDKGFEVVKQHAPRAKQQAGKRHLSFNRRMAGIVYAQYKMVIKCLQRHIYISLIELIPGRALILLKKSPSAKAKPPGSSMRTSHSEFSGTR